jgi:hypothetical protein
MFHRNDALVKASSIIVSEGGCSMYPMPRDVLALLLGPGTTSPPIWSTLATATSSSTASSAGRFA